MPFKVISSIYFKAKAWNVRQLRCYHLRISEFQILIIKIEIINQNHKHKIINKIKFINHNNKKDIIIKHNNNITKHSNKTHMNHNNKKNIIINIEIINQNS